MSNWTAARSACSLAMFTLKPTTCTGRTLDLPRKDWDIRYLRHLGNSDIANYVALLLLPMNVQSASACSSMISKSRTIRWLTRFAAVEARSSHRAMVWRAWPVTRAVAELLTPSTRRLATWSHSLRAQRRPLYAVPVCVLTVPPQTVQRYRQRRPHFVGNEPGPTMLGSPKVRVGHFASLTLGGGSSMSVPQRHDHPDERGRRVTPKSENSAPSVQAGKSRMCTVSHLSIVI